MGWKFADLVPEGLWINSYNKPPGTQHFAIAFGQTQKLSPPFMPFNPDRSLEMEGLKRLCHFPVRLSNLPKVI